jgi:hypothetical protein
MTDEYNVLTEEEIDLFSDAELRSFVKILRERTIVALKKISLFQETAEDLRTHDQLQRAMIEMLTDVNNTLHGGLERLEGKNEKLQSEIAVLQSRKPKM